MKRIFTKTILLIALAVAVIAGGAALFLNKSSDGGADSTAEASGQVWTCSMHPQVRLPKPGKCPICSMPLIPAKRRPSPRPPTKTPVQCWNCPNTRERWRALKLRRFCAAK